MTSKTRRLFPTCTYAPANHLQDAAKSSITTSRLDTWSTSVFKRTKARVQHHVLVMLVRLQPSFSWC